ncbi:helix-turn-helix domain-containing protein [Streptomyces sp. AC627_RSS907]|uniref:TetR/AcrR family transcriptional regulator n=1 Tax=Streptomyces sp. AC627_RSS907 TaxID=2823684 RepID=UPI0027E40F20|nr:helix-turn-helix domain-containing protein [Streptomyces sp. AC627_RSS907]
MNAAFQLAEREGPAGLSMRRLAQELEVDVSILYRLFRDKDELILALCERTIEIELDEIGAAPEQEAWQDTLRRIADVTWAYQIRFPAITLLSFARTTGGPSEARMVELLLSAFERAGLPPAQAVLFYRTFIDTALGLCAHSASLSTLAPEDREKDDSAWTRVYSRLPERQYPATTKHIHDLTAVTQKAIYTSAIEAILAAAEHAAAQHANRLPLITPPLAE